MSRVQVVASIAVAVFLLAASHIALAQSQEEWREASEQPSPDLVLNESYHGTVPGAGNTLPRIEEIRTKAGNWITWPGFLMRPDGGSRIFIQTTRALDYKRDRKGKRITLYFNDASVYLSNNRNPLVTIHFNTPVRRAYLKHRMKTAELVMELKVDAEASIKQFADGDGYHYLFVDFPAGQYPVGGDWGTRPSFEGFGRPTAQEEEGLVEENPPREE
jgi:hypothetical protein